MHILDRVRLGCRLLFAFVAVAHVVAGRGIAQSADRSPWPADVVEAIEELPVQDAGRIKPLLAYARQILLQLSERQSITLADDTKLSATEWLLDVMFRNAVTRDDRVFLVTNKEILDAIEVSHDARKMRDRYSYNELASGVQKLFELSDQYRATLQRERKKVGDLPLVQGQILGLADDVWLYQRLGVEFAMLAQRHPLDDAGLEALFGGKTARASQACEHGLDLHRRLKAEMATVDDNEITPLKRLLLAVFDAVPRGGGRLKIFPASDAANPDWSSAADILDRSLRADEAAVQRAPLLRALEAFVDGPAKVTLADATALRDAVTKAATARGEAGAVSYELTLERGAFLHWIRGLFLISLVLVALLWWKPQATLYGRLVYMVALVPVVLMTVMIVLRCAIRYHDPSTDILAPVTNLYETIPFITVIGAGILLFVEFVTKNRIGLSLAILLGFVGSQLALSYEPLDGGDNLAPLQAVLVSNFWLLTHVQTVTVGYAACLVASVLAHVWLLRRLVLHLRRDRAPAADPMLKAVMRFCYGAVAFGLVFSTVGTILGGIWANDSWGRFWGWDPKENGALMICLWQAMMLHCRMAGFVRHLGFAALTIVLGMITAFSWWHVNQLGVGLHSYGFTKGILQALYVFYSIEGVVLLGVLFSKAVAVVAAQQVQALPRGGDAPVKAQERFDA